MRFSRQEADEIARLANNDLKLEAVDFEANRTLATSAELGQYRVVHFATHGLINNTHPELSGIVLSLVDEKGQPQNGFLRLYDLYNLKLSADLVVLSACQTALGKEIQRRRSRRTDARIHVRRRAARGRESLADRRSSLGRIYETLLRRNAGPKTATRRRAPRRTGLDVERPTLAPATLLGRLHAPGRMEISHKEAQKAQNYMRLPSLNNILCFLCLFVATFFGISLALVSQQSKL